MPHSQSPQCFSRFSFGFQTPRYSLHESVREAPNQHMHTRDRLPLQIRPDFDHRILGRQVTELKLAVIEAVSPRRCSVARLLPRRRRRVHTFWPSVMRSLESAEVAADDDPGCCGTASRATARSLLLPSTSVMRSEKACSSGASLDLSRHRPRIEATRCVEDCLGDEGAEFPGNTGDGNC
jgi:hypothetical protein